MFLSISVDAIINPLFELSTGNDYDSRAEIQTERIDLGSHRSLKTEGNILHMPGIFLVDSKMSTTVTQEFLIFLEGEHYLFNLISTGGVQANGKMQLQDSTSGEIYHDASSSRKINITVSPGYYSRRIFLVVSNTYIRELLKDEPWDVNAFLDATRCSYQSNVSIMSLLDEINGNVNDGPYRRPFFELKLKDFFLNLHRCSVELFPGHDMTMEDKYKLIAARDYLIAEYVNPPTIPELSRIVMLNEFKLKLCFKLVFGNTIHNYVIALRMQRAERMLLQTFSVAEVSEQIGYKSVSHFILAFRRYFGTTPKQWMKKKYQTLVDPQVGSSSFLPRP